MSEREEVAKLNGGQLLALITLVLLILAAFLGAAFLYRQQGQLDSLSRQLTQLKLQLAQSSSSAQPAADNLQHLAYVNTTKVAAGYLKMDQQLQSEVEAKKAKLSKELGQLKQQLKEQTITQDEFNVKILDIQEKLTKIKQEALARVSNKINAVIAQIGREGGWDLITGEANVVLYSRAGLMQDLTGEVLARLQAGLPPGP